MGKVGKDDFARFVAHCKYWMRELSLSNYFFSFREDGDSGDEAYIVPDEALKNVSVFLNCEDRMFGVDRLARHEMLEVLVEEMADALMGFLSAERVLKMRHEIVHRLEKVLPLPTDKTVGYVKRGGK